MAASRCDDLMLHISGRSHDLQGDLLSLPPAACGFVTPYQATWPMRGWGRDVSLNQGQHAVHKLCRMSNGERRAHYSRGESYQDILLLLLLCAVKLIQASQPHSHCGDDGVHLSCCWSFSSSAPFDFYWHPGPSQRTGSSHNIPNLRTWVCICASILVYFLCGLLYSCKSVPVPSFKGVCRLLVLYHCSAITSKRNAMLYPKGQWHAQHDGSLQHQSQILNFCPNKKEHRTLTPWRKELAYSLDPVTVFAATPLVASVLCTPAC